MIFPQRLDPSGQPLNGFFDDVWSSLQTATGSVTSAVKTTANTVCPVLNNQLVQSGLSQLPKGVNTVTDAMGRMCSPGTATSPAGVTAKWPSGAIAYRDSSGLFHIAIPKVSRGLFGVELMGKREEAFDNSYARQLHSGYGYQENAMRSSRGGLGETHEEVAVDTEASNALVVLKPTFDAAIAKPIYKKWWFWAAIGGVALAGTGAVIYVRRKRS